MVDGFQLTAKAQGGPPSSGSVKVRKRIPRPPSSLRIKCAFFWSCCACLAGSFLCAIPALRYTVTVSGAAGRPVCHRKKTLSGKKHCPVLLS